MTLSRDELAHGVKEGERPLGTIAMHEVVGLELGSRDHPPFQPQIFPAFEAVVQTCHDIEARCSGEQGRTSPTKSERQHAEEAELHREEFAICCTLAGYQRRMYVFQCPDQPTRERWIELLSRTITYHSVNPLLTASALQVCDSEIH